MDVLHYFNFERYYLKLLLILVTRILQRWPTAPVCLIHLTLVLMLGFKVS